MAATYCTNLIEDSRWSELLERHHDASVFHTAAWHRALRLTYGYQAVAFTTSSPDSPLIDGIVFSLIRSWLTGTRLVSVAFADHCQPLLSSETALSEILLNVRQYCDAERAKYVECRWMNSPTLSAVEPDGFGSSQSYALHRLDLRPRLEDIFNKFHKSCIQRKIQRAEKEALVYSEGSSDEMLRAFYRLLILTRRRHGVPPQPLAWFRNLRDCFGPALKVRLASRNGRALAGLLTLQFKNRMVYKYGCSDAAFHRLGTMPWLFWHAVQDAKACGMAELDLGRSDLTAPSLIKFKSHLGATSSIVTNYRYPSSARVGKNNISLGFKLCTHLPTPILRAAGTLFYRHAG